VDVGWGFMEKPVLTFTS